jgi:hypothetical protein
MSSVNGKADWVDDDAFRVDLTSYIAKRTSLSVEQVDLAERTSRLFEAACYRGFGGPIMLGFEDVDFGALNAKHPDLVPADNYFVHPSYEDRVLFVAAEAGLSLRQTVDFLAGEMRFCRAAGIAAREVDEAPAFLEWAKEWLREREPRPAHHPKPDPRQLRLVTDEEDGPA